MFRAPSQAGLPSLHLMLADIPANDRQIAKHLGISLSTLQRYRREEQAPRAIMLALFFETRWGRSAADAEAANFASIQAGLNAALKRKNAALERHLVELELELSRGGGSAANTPFFEPGRVSGAS